MKLDIPDRVYQAVLATWCAAVVGVVVLFGGNYLTHSRSASGGAKPVETHPATVEALMATEKSLREHNARLERDLAAALECIDDLESQLAALHSR